jgi:hypothetical protein
MVQPYNYSLNIGSPFEAFTQGMQIGGAARAAEQQAAEQARATDQRSRLNRAMSSLGPDANYADYMEQVRANPDLAEVLLGQQQQFTAARRNALFNVGSEAFSLLRPSLDGSIDPERAAAVLETNALAFENSGEADVAKQLRDAAQGIRLNPATGRTVLGTMLAFSDPERFRSISQAMGGEQEMTTFQKDLLAAGIDPNSQLGRDLSRQYVEGRADPIVEIVTPDGTGIYRGPFSEYSRRYGTANVGASDTPPAQAPAGPQILPRSQRPDMTDAELISWGNRSAREGMDVNYIFRQLHEWGVNE